MLRELSRHRKFVLILYYQSATTLIDISQVAVLWLVMGCSQFDLSRQFIYVGNHHRIIHKQGRGSDVHGDTHLMPESSDGHAFPQPPYFWGGASGVQLIPNQTLAPGSRH
jgi:hypothetical protein